MIVYRADTRAPNQIRASGFKARLPMTIEQARLHLLSYCTPQSDPQRTPMDLSRRIISSPQPEYVSTDPSEECGGYASTKGYVYKIEFPHLTQKVFSTSVLGQTLKKNPNTLWPKLYLDAAQLWFANIIALKHFGTSTREITFLTSIPVKNIVGYRAPNEKAFSPFNAPPPRPTSKPWRT
jgi:hypothetical protein